MATQGPIPPGPYVKVTLHFQESTTILYGSSFKVAIAGGGPAAITDLNTMASQVSGGFSANLASHTPSAVILVSVTAQDMSTRTGNVGQFVGNVPGTDSSPPQESGNATIVQHKIATHYRGGHPKAYMPTGSLAVLQPPANYTPAYTGAYATGYAAMVATVINKVYGSFNTGGQVAVSNYSGPLDNSADTDKWSPKNVPKLRTTPQLYPVTAIAVPSLIGSQKRRRQSTGA